MLLVLLSKFNHKRFHKVAFILLFPTLSFAQSVQVSSDNAYPRVCFQTASSASSIKGFELSPNMIEPCNVALVELGLSDEDRAATFVNRGILHAASGSLAEAFSDYEEALNLRPTLGEVFINRGFLYHYENELDLALEDYNRALELNIQEKHLAYFARGIVHEEKNRWSEAAKDYQQSLVHSPDWEPAKTRLEQVLNRTTTYTYDLVSNP